MTILILTFILAFAALMGAGLLLFDNASDPGQISAVISATRAPATAGEKARSVLSSIGRIVGSLERFVPKSASSLSLVQKQLLRAGYRQESAVRYFYGAKVAAMVFLTSVMVLSGLASKNLFFSILGSVAVGFLGPDFWLTRRMTVRNRLIRRGLPDFLDLLIVCMEAGLSLDQATSRTVEELNKGKSAIAEEVGLVILEQRAGSPRVEAWKHLAERTNEPSVRGVVSMLVQSEQFGTSVAKALRVHSETLRTQRIQQVEEQAAKTTIKILFPLVLLIFPAIFVVALGPAIIQMVDSFNQNINH